MNTSLQYALLDDPLFTVTLDDGVQNQISLAEILHLLSTGQSPCFDALQAHQQQAWHCFLVQLAAMAASRHNDSKFPETAEKWKGLILALSSGNVEAWHLVVQDFTKPAFMQVPVQDGDLEKAGYKKDIETPEDLDTLLLSRNHDIKSNRINIGAPEHWIYSLVNNQTMNGNMGRGNYGIVRMNGGFGSRPLIGYSNTMDASGRFQRDVQILLKNRKQHAGIYNLNGFSLLWLETWDGGKISSLPIYKCDPYFIEICRRIRFSNEGGLLACYRANSEATRIKAPENLNGKTGDPWTPVGIKDQKSLTISHSGFSYELIQKIMLQEEFEKPMTMEIQETDSEAVFLICQGMARGQGKTEGLHQRTIKVPGVVRARLLSNRSEMEKLAKKAAERVEMAKNTAHKILRPSIAILLSSGSDKRVDSEKTSGFIRKFDKAIDQSFFDALWESIDLDQEVAKIRWAKLLFREAETVYRQAEQSTPVASLRKYRALSTARSMFYAQSSKVLQLPQKN